MRIIKQGALAAEALFRTTCTSCGTEYEFARKEARHSSDQRDGNALITKCPMRGCDQENWKAVSTPGGSQWDR